MRLRFRVLFNLSSLLLVNSLGQNQSFAADSVPATYERAMAAYSRKQYADAERLALEAVAEAKEKLPPDKSMMLRAYYAAGLSAKSRGDDRKAAAHFTESAALADKSRDPREWVLINYSLASAHRSCGNYKESEVLCRQIVPLCTKEHGAEHTVSRAGSGGVAALNPRLISRVIAKSHFRNGGRRPAGRRGKPAGLPHHFGNDFWQPV